MVNKNAFKSHLMRTVSAAALSVSFGVAGIPVKPREVLPDGTTSQIIERKTASG